MKSSRRRQSQSLLSSVEPEGGRQKYYDGSEEKSCSTNTVDNIDASNHNDPHLFPKSADYRIRFKELQSASKNSTAKVLVLQAKCKASSSGSTLQRVHPPCVLAGKCTLTATCLLIQQRNRQRNQISWSNHYQSCPRCSTKLPLESSCYLLFYPVVNVDLETTPYSIASHVTPRLICPRCMAHIASRQQKTGSNSNNSNNNTVRWGAMEYLDGNRIPIFGETHSISLQCRMSASVLQQYWETATGSLWQRVEEYLTGYAYQQAMEQLRSSKVHHRVRRDGFLLEARHRICQACHKPDAKLLCACRTVIYCSKECAENDWKQHHALECSQCDPSMIQQTISTKTTVSKPRVHWKLDHQKVAPQQMSSKQKQPKKLRKKGILPTWNLRVIE